MYSIYVDDDLLYAPLLFHEGCSLYSPRLTLELNKAGSLEFTMPQTNLLYNNIEKLKSVIRVLKDDEEIFRGRLLHDEKDFYKQKRAYCEGELAYLIDTIQRPYKFEGEVGDLFKQYISNHNSKVEVVKQFTVGQITVSGTINCESKDYPNTLDEINTQIVGTTGGYLNPRLKDGVRYLDLLDPYAESGASFSSQTIEFGVNLLDVTEYITAEDIFTVLIPLGATIYDDEGNVVIDKLTVAEANDGKDYIEDSAAIALFGRIERKEEWSDVKDAGTLLSEGKKFLANNIALAMSLTVKAIDLRLLDVNYERIRLGDWVGVISLPHDLNRYFQCTKIVYDLENPDQNEYTFGYTTSSLTEQQVIEKKKTQNSIGVLSGLRTGVNQILNGGGSPPIPPTPPTPGGGDEPGGDVPTGLPTGYTAVDFIESTGTQYIDTGFMPNQDTRLVVDMDILPKTTPYAVFGGRKESKSDNFVVFSLIDGEGWQSDYGDQKKYYIAEGVVSNSGRHVIEKNKAEFYVDGTLLHTSAANTFQCSYTIYLMQINDAGATMSSYPFYGKLYSCKIYDNGILVRDYVPCINDSGVAGLFDLVTREFYNNAGTGVFRTNKDYELPSDYIELGYIEATGTQYIDTGFMPTNKTRVVMDYLNTGDYSGNSSSVSMLFGARAGTASDAYALWLSNDALYPNFADASYSAYGSLPVDMSKRFTVDMNGNVLSVNGTELVCTDSAFESSYSLVLLALNAKGTITARNTSGKIYSCKIYDNGSIVRDYIPCIGPNNEVGLYDLITREFYGNDGTGLFYGGYKVELPDGYTTVEFIESNGTQYIDTGFKNNQDSRIVFTGQVTKTPTAHAWLFGARNSSTKGARNLFLYQGTTWSADYNSDSTRYSFTNINVLEKIAVDFNKNVLNINGESHSYTATTFQCNHNHVLFGQNNAGTIGNFISARLYSCQIYDNGTLIRDYVPCINPNNEVGLYDLVTKEFYGNAGTGVFKTNNDYVLPSDYIELEYIESTGTQYIDTGVSITTSNYNTLKFEVDAQMLDTTGTEWALNGTGVYNQNQMYIGTNSGSIYYSGNGSDINTSVSYDYTRRTWIYDTVNSKVSVGGLLDTSIELNAPKISKNFLLFAYASPSGQTCSKQKQWGAKIWENGSLIRDYVPCISPNNEVGLYDLINGQFYGNAGAGLFYGGMKHDLPDGYTELKCIESTGTQYIDTGFKPNQDSKVKIDFEVTGLPSDYGAVFSARNEASGSITGAFSLWVNAINNTFLWQYNTNAGQNTTTNNPTVVGNRVIAENTSNVMVIDGQTLTESAVDLTLNYPLYLLATSDSGTNRYCLKAKVYTCQIYDNGTLVRDYVPCINPNNEVGLYDLVTKSFYSNAGTGVFIGIDKTGLPLSYTKVNYIKTTGDLQYIDTGFKPKYNTRVVMEVSDVPNESSYLFGARDTASGTSPQQFGFYRRSATELRSDYFGTNEIITVSDTTQRTIIDKNANVVTAYGVTITNTAVSSGEVSYNLYLFVLNSAGKASTPYGVMKLYSCQIYDNGTLIRDYIPCINDSGVAGLYDTVNYKFYANAGTGTFVTG